MCTALPVQRLALALVAVGSACAQHARTRRRLRSRLVQLRLELAEHVAERAKRAAVELATGEDRSSFDQHDCVAQAVHAL